MQLRQHYLKLFGSFGPMNLNHLPAIVHLLHQFFVGEGDFHNFPRFINLIG
jgi:hypothetical protein